METALIYVNGAVALTDSILVAKKFEKDHQHVLRDIRNLLEGMSKIGDTPMFEETTYIHPQNGQEYSPQQSAKPCRNTAAKTTSNSALRNTRHSAMSTYIPTMRYKPHSQNSSRISHPKVLLFSYNVKFC